MRRDITLKGMSTLCHERNGCEADMWSDSALFTFSRGEGRVNGIVS